MSPWFRRHCKPMSSRTYHVVRKEVSWYAFQSTFDQIRHLCFLYKRINPLDCMISLLPQVFFDRVEVVNRLGKEFAANTIRRFGMFDQHRDVAPLFALFLLTHCVHSHSGEHYDKIWIFDRIHHGRSIFIFKLFYYCSIPNQKTNTV